MFIITLKHIQSVLELFPTDTAIDPVAKSWWSTSANVHPPDALWFKWYIAPGVVVILPNFTISPIAPFSSNATEDVEYTFLSTLDNVLPVIEDSNTVVPPASTCTVLIPNAILVSVSSRCIILSPIY